MPDKNWMKEIPPLHLPEETDLQQRIQKRVQEQLHTKQKQEEQIMMKKTVKRRIRPLILIAAVIGIGAASLVTANAATDGAVLTKISFFINGEEQTLDGELVETDDGAYIYKWKPEDYDSDTEYEIEYGEFMTDDGYEVQCEEGADENDDTIIFRIDTDSEAENSGTEEN